MTYTVGQIVQNAPAFRVEDGATVFSLYRIEKIEFLALIVKKVADVTILNEQRPNETMTIENASPEVDAILFEDEVALWNQS